MLAVGEGDIYMLSTLTRESHKFTGTGKMSTAVGSEGHNELKERPYMIPPSPAKPPEPEIALPAPGLDSVRNQGVGAESLSSCQRR